MPIISLFRLLSLSVALCLTTNAQAQELRPGRYVGAIHLDESQDKIAVIADVLIEAPEDFKSFPKLIAIIRLNLGKYNSHEYLTEVFKSIRFDFDTGRLAFDEPENDLLITAALQIVSGRTQLRGEVFIRSAALSGTIELLEQPSEPDGDENVSIVEVKSERFLSLFDGQYEGRCGGESTVLQVQSIRGLQSEHESQAGSQLDRYYGLTGRLAFKNNKLCGELPKDRWCTRYYFNKGTYNFYLGSVTFQSEHTSMDCRIVGAQMNCRVQAFDGVRMCQFQKPQATVEKPKFFARRTNIKPTEDQLKELPQPEPPLNEDLTRALKGLFYGYVHNEYTDSYIPIKLHVASYSATDNPHNPNQMMISATASLYWGGVDSPSFTTQRYEARSFYLHPGFILSGLNTDTFIEIVDWRMGLVRGVLYSRAFGKVGTVQLLKGQWPELTGDAATISAFAGEFARRVSDKVTRWIRFVFLPHSSALNDSIVQLTGSYQSIVGVTPVAGIDRGTLDPYTERLGWEISKDDVVTFGTGKLGGADETLLFWPASPILGGVTSSYTFESYRRAEPGRKHD